MCTKISSRGANGNSGSKWIRPERRLAIYLRDSFRCLYCCRDLHGADVRDVTLDHVRPGHDDHSNGNLVTACRSCNSSRQDKPITRFAGPETVKDIRRQLRRDVAPFLRLAKAIISGDVGRDAALEGIRG